MKFDIIVIGGAASGATLALRMARAGWNVAVVEKSVYPRRKVCGEFLSATNTPLFEDLGITEKVYGTSGPSVTEVGVFHKDRIITAPMPLINGAPGMKSVALGRDKLDDWLMSEAKRFGSTAFQPARVTGIGCDGQLKTVAIQTAAGEEITATAPIVVGAHGSWGKSNLATFPAERPARPGDLFGFKGLFRNGSLPRGLMPLFIFDGGYGGLVETDEGRTSFSCCVRRDKLPEIQKTSGERGTPPGEALVRYLIDDVRGLSGALSGAVLDSPMLSCGPIRPGIRKPYEHGIFRVGNAAGEAHPVIAEGITLAMQSSWLLSEEWLAAGRKGDPNQVARRYGRRWSREFSPRIACSFLFAHFAMNQTLAGGMARCLELFPSLVSIGASLSGKNQIVIGKRSRDGSFSRFTT